MPLTTRQQQWALSPYRILSADLYRLMEILSDRTEWAVFGDSQVGVIRMVLHAAERRNLAVPIAFRRAFEAGASDPNLFSRVKDHSPTGEISREPL